MGPALLVGPSSIQSQGHPFEELAGLSLWMGLDVGQILLQELNIHHILFLLPLLVCCLVSFYDKVGILIFRLSFDVAEPPSHFAKFLIIQASDKHK